MSQNLRCVASRHQQTHWVSNAGPSCRSPNQHRNITSQPQEHLTGRAVSRLAASLQLIDMFSNIDFTFHGDSETEVSFWRNFRHRLHRKLSFWPFAVEPWNLTGVITVGPSMRLSDFKAIVQFLTYIAQFRCFVRSYKIRVMSWWIKALQHLWCLWGSLNVRFYEVIKMLYESVKMKPIDFLPIATTVSAAVQTMPYHIQFIP